MPYGTKKRWMINPAPTHWVMIVGAICVLAAFPVFAAKGGEPPMDWGNMIMQLLGGLALFLFGMEQMSDALKAVAGERMKVILARLTTNRFMGAITGAFVTAIIQSSSVTTVLVVGFVSAGLMSMAQSIGVIMGANIGTTITAQIVAFKVTKLSMLMIAMGFAMLFFSKQEKIKQYGGMLMGLGMVFFGMSVMSDAMSPLRTYQPFLDMMTHMANPLIGILVGAAFTALVQSSSATTGIVIVMASQGFISLPAGIALAFGANIGTCVTALLAAIGKTREAIRAALVHVLFNILGVLLWIGFIAQLADFVSNISPTAAGLTGTDKLAAEAPRQIANAHTIFNITNTLVFIWFTGPLARLVEALVPDKPIDEGIIVKPKYLDEELLETPSLALDRARLEIARMGEVVSEMMHASMPAFISGDKATLKAVAAQDDAADILHGHIITYLGQVGRKSLTEQEAAQLSDLFAAANDIESIGDILETDLMGLGEKRLKKKLRVSPQTSQMLTDLHSTISKTVTDAVAALKNDDQILAQRVIAMKGDIQEMMESAAQHQQERLISDEPNRLTMYSIEIEVIEKLKRIYYFAKRIAKGAAPIELRVRASN